ncbi:hypothetical protein O181_038328 [Austropuccinia psidii MF-1]|uniref:Uncharacterized protein n=1 Tax=Austropuccinia psidii MF-1 TaxID=1389203 RepID=A0A9Q3DD47_9BASI|nr:hypothetical protein [Austropuccinia psidii MF-1]
MSSKLTELTDSSPSVLHHLFFVVLASSVGWLPLGTLILAKPMMATRKLEFLILLVLNFWQREKIFFSTSTPNLPSITSVLLGRNHVIVLCQQLPTSEGTCGVSRMTLLGRSSQFLRAQLLMLLQDILIKDVARWTNVEGSIPVGGRPIYSSSAVPIYRINTEGVVKRIRRISDFPPNLDAEGSDELDGEEVQVVNNPVGQKYSTSSSKPPCKRFQSHLIPSNPRNFQPTLAAIPNSLPHSSPSPTPGLP